MRNPEVIYFEGLPGSGKTTLTTQIANSRPDMLVSIGEYVHPGKNIPENYTNQRFFMENDELKYRAARESGRKSLVDRGHLSTVLYAHAYKQIRGDKDLSYVDDWYVGKILKDKMLPDMYIFLDIPAEVSIMRRISTFDPDNNIWDHLQALNFARENYPRYMGLFEPNVPVLTLSSVTMTIAELKKEIATILGINMDYSSRLLQL